MTAPSGAVFLSYASQDAEAARRICESLRAAGIEVWFDQSELRGGDAWDQKIRRQIRECVLFVPIISAHTQARLEGYFRREWKLAVDRTHDMAEERAYLVPIVIDDTQDQNASVPEKFREVQWTRLAGGEMPPAVSARIAALLGRPHQLAQASPRPLPPVAGPRRFSRWIAAVVACVLVVVAITWQPWRLLAPKAGTDSAGQPNLARPASAAPERSIAVLPFADLSEKKDQEFFSDGLTEELLDLLAKTPGLQVIARTSSFSFRGKSDDIPTIARKLNVANVLEGSVRKSGIRLRVTTQLIRADTGVHIWSETYDREVRDVFKVQDEIAGAITRVLTHRLLGGDEAGTSNSPKAMDQVAYLLYLEGQHEFRPHTKEGTEKAIELFKQVTVLQPDFSDGFAALGAAYLNNAEDHKERTDLIPAAGAALARALSLDPTNLRAVSSHLDLALHTRDWPTAAADARRMKAINPYSATTLGEMFRYYQLLGFPDLALEAARGAAALDPLSFVRRLNVASALLHIARYSDAAAAALSALELQPKHVFVLSLLCTADAYSGRVDDARAIAAELSPGKDPDDWDGCLFDIAVAERRLADARKLNDTMAARFPGGSNTSSDLAANYAVAHEFDLAATWLERGYDKKDFAIFAFQFNATIPRAFFDTDRWEKFLRRPMMVAWQQAHDRLAAEFAAEGQKPASGI